jgi:D-sedoheptulose 7-phosphate isomerase
MNPTIQQELDDHCRVAALVAATLERPLAAACDLAVGTLQAGGKILLCGNGGSAADAQHLAAELTGRFRRQRGALAAIALSTDTSALTAIGNDFGFEQVFSRQVEALARPGDLVIGISTSGNSANVASALRAARAAGCTTIGLTGRTGGLLAAWCDVALQVPADDTARIQEMHILLGHTLCHVVETALAAAPPLKIVPHAA